MSQTYDQVIAEHDELERGGGAVGQRRGRG
jgi:hypothetical protein